MRAAVYLRQSLDKTGEGVAVARQREDCLKLCAEKGWEPVEYLDNDTSASNGKHRPAYEKMLTDITDGSIGAVVAWDLDRLHRRPIELEKFMQLADEKHIALATVSGDVDLSTAQGRLTARLKGSVAAHEIEHKAARQRRAARQKAEHGAPNWKRAFGYLGDTYQPDPHTAPLVREAYATILAGGSLADVARTWNTAEAYTLQGNPWTPRELSTFLRKPRNAGLRAHNGEIVGPGTWPPLVDETTWRAAQAVLNASGRSPGRKTVRKHLLTGVLRCGNCGHHLCGNYATHKQITYGCKQCRALSIRAAHIEPLIIELVVGRLAKPDAIDLLRAELHDQAEAEALRLESNMLHTRLDSLAVEFADGELTASQLRAATGRLNEKIGAVERRSQDQERLRVFDGLPLGLPEVANAVRGLSPDRLRSVIDVLMTVTVAPVGKGGNAFNPERVQVVWK